jgi:copper chaperone CopZ
VRLIPIALVALIVVLAFGIVSRPVPGERISTDTSLQIVVSSASAAEQVEFPIQLQEGNDPEHEADHVIEPLKGMAGIASATLDWSSSLVLVVDYDPAQVSSPQIADTLAKIGYLKAPTQP